MAALRFGPETGHHAPRLRCSVFRNEAGRWQLRLIAENGSCGHREFDSQEAAFAGVKPLYAELIGAAP